MGGVVSTVVVALAACSSAEPVGSSDSDAGADAAVDATPDSAAPAPYPLDQTCAQVTLPEGTADKACLECSQSRCCTTRSAALALPETAELSKCYGDKSCDAKCEEACFAKYAVATQPVLDHVACTTYLCPACLAAPLDACQTCQQARCRTEDLDCSRSSACLVITGCMDACEGNRACIDKCKVDFPAGVEKVTKLLDCALARCTTECKK